MNIDDWSLQQNGELGSSSHDFHAFLESVKTFGTIFITLEIRMLKKILISGFLN